MENKNSRINETNLKGVYTIDSQTLGDERGFFKEMFRRDELEEIIGYPFSPVQENHSKSYKGVLRGIHISPWSKLIYCVKGNIQIVIVDFKKDSPTFGNYTSLIIGDDNRVKIFVPKYCGNSYLVLSEEADYTYITDDYWKPGKEIGVIWNDPDLKINWNIRGYPNLSEKDKKNPLLENILPEIIKAQI